MKLDGEIDAKRLVLSILPEPVVRRRCLAVFAEAVAEANVYGRDKWAVTPTDSKVRLQVGHVIICTLGKGRIWMALDKGLSETPKRRSSLNQSGDWKWDSEVYPEYPSISSRNGYYLPSEKHAEAWPEVRRLHFEAIYRAANGRPMDPRTPQGHSPAILRFLRNELGRHVPDPLY